MPHIQVNLPRTKDDFISGNGEGCWVLVPNETKAKHDNHYSGDIFEGILANDSWYYPDLKSGEAILFTMKGIYRPVALIDNCLDQFQAISDEEFQRLLHHISSVSKNR